MSRTENVELTVLCLIEDGNKILLQNRAKKDWQGYALPGGHVEPGESFVDAVIREMKEETGLTILDPRLVGVKQFPLENGRYVVLLFKATQWSGDLIATMFFLSFAFYLDIDKSEYVDLLNNPDYEIVYEKHGWSFVKEFFSEFSTLDEGQDYAMLFLLSQNKSNHNAFVNTALGMLLSCNPKDPDNKRSLSCNASDSSDGQNHFWLLKRK